MVMADGGSVNVLEPPSPSSAPTTSTVPTPTYQSRSIEDYALIGNTYTAALVSSGGSIDWLCFPRFDGPACFSALLGNPDHGHWVLVPEGEVTAVRRRYRKDTLVLETDVSTASGAVRIIDFMPYPDDENSLDVVRIVQGLHGRVAMRMEFALRFDYGRTIPWVRRYDFGLRAVAGPDAVRFQSPCNLRGEKFRTVSRFSVEAGQKVSFVLTWYPSHKPEPRERDAEALLRKTEAWWRKWISQSTYQGEWQEEVRRSLITLKALTYGPTGGIVAAATTSLPEFIGGVRNWDYRYCWLRDSTFTLYSLLINGFRAEAEAWRQWLLRAVAGRPSDVQIMYTLLGERRLEEIELPWLPGYAGSRPVRVGNAAYEQRQLDIFGEIFDSFHTCRKYVLEESEDHWQVQKVLLDFLESRWHEPDEGIWEIRGPEQHFTYSKVMAWVAADRAVKAVEQFDYDGPVEQWRKLRDTIHADVCQNALDSERGCFVQAYGSKRLDASLLMMPMVGFLPASDRRVVATVEAIEKELVTDGFVLRYTPDGGADGLPAGEGTFLACSFWLVDNYAMMGRKDKAREMFMRLLELRNDVGLLAEEYDPKARRQLGNFPQAFSHIGIINSAHNLSSTSGPAARRAG